jgi:hypothetical protein
MDYQSLTKAELDAIEARVSGFAGNNNLHIACKRLLAEVRELRHRCEGYEVNMKLWHEERGNAAFLQARVWELEAVISGLRGQIAQAVCDHLDDSSRHPQFNLVLDSIILRAEEAVADKEPS